MKSGFIQVYYGDQVAKTTAAIGQGIYAIGKDKKVIMIQFLNESNSCDTAFLKKLEPEFKVFSFAKKKTDDQNFCYVDELKTEVITALNFTKKILDTGECDILILDEIIGAVYKKYMSEEMIFDLLEHKSSNTSVILTGCMLLDSIAQKADYVYYIKAEKKPE